MEYVLLLIGFILIVNFSDILVDAASSVANSLKIADGVQIAGNSGVAKDIKEPRSAWGGSPAMPAMKWHKMHIKLEKMMENKKGEKNE